MRFKQYLIEEEKKEQQDVVFKETDGKSPFPENTIKALKKHINRTASDLEVEWNSPVEVANLAFEELDVPQPIAGNSDRWSQYLDLLNHAILQLYKARGNDYARFRSV